VNLEAGRYWTVAGDEATLHFQTGDGCWHGEVKDELRSWTPSGESLGWDDGDDLSRPLEK
jgi:hypothetical protein